MVENRVNLLDEIKDVPKNSKILMTSFAFDPLFFEGFVLPSLNDRNAQELNVLLDSSSYDETFGDSTKVKKIGREYHPQRVLMDDGVFHPKVVLCISEKKVLGWIGSSNITLPGFTKNAEFVSIFKLDEKSNPNEIDVGKQLIDIINEIIESGFIVGDKIKTLEWIKKADSSKRDTWILSNIRVPILKFVKDEIIKDNVKNIKIISPFFSVSTVKALKNFFGNPRVEIFVQQEQNDLDDKKLKELSKLVGISYFEIEDFVKRKNGEVVIEDHRRLHGKMLVFEGEENDYCLAGSANFTRPALELDATKGNFEIVSLTRHKKGELSQLLKNEYFRFKKISAKDIQSTKIIKEKIKSKESMLNLRKAYLDEDGIMKLYLEDYDGEDYTLFIPELEISKEVNTSGLSLDFNKHFASIKKSPCSLFVEIGGVKSNRVWIETESEYSFGFDVETDSKIRTALKTFGREGLIDLFLEGDFNALIFTVKELENLESQARPNRAAGYKKGTFSRRSSEFKSIIDLLNKLIKKKKLADEKPKGYKSHPSSSPSDFIYLSPKKRSIPIGDSVLIIVETNMEIEKGDIEFTVEPEEKHFETEVVETVGAPCLMLTSEDPGFLTIRATATNSRGETYERYTKIFVYDRSEITVKFINYCQTSIEKIIYDDSEKNFARLFGFLIQEFKVLLLGLLNDELEVTSSIECVEYTMTLLSNFSSNQGGYAGEGFDETEELLMKKIKEENIFQWLVLLWWIANKKAANPLSIGSDKLLDSILLNVSSFLLIVENIERIIQGINEILDSLPSKFKGEISTIISSKEFDEHIKSTLEDIADKYVKQVQKQIDSLESKPKTHGFLKPQGFDSYDNRFLYTIDGLNVADERKVIPYGAPIYGLKWPDDPTTFENFEWYKLTKKECDILSKNKGILKRYLSLLDDLKEFNKHDFEISA